MSMANGLKYKYFLQNFHVTTPDDMQTFFDRFENNSCAGEGIYDKKINYSGTGRPSFLPSSNYSIEFSGYFYVPETGLYTLGISGDDTHSLELEGEPLLFSPMWQYSNSYETTTNITLYKGYYKIRLRQAQGTGGDGLDFGWKKPGDSSITAVPFENLFHELKFVNDYALARYTKKIKTEMDKYTKGIEVPYRPELCITKDSLVCPYTGRRPIGYDKLEETNCSPDGVIMSDDLNIQKTEHGWWFGKGTENLAKFPYISNITNNIPGNFRPGWDASKHTKVITVASWSSGYNSGVSESAQVKHAHWEHDEDGKTPICVYDDLGNDAFTTSRWMGISRSIGTWSSKGLTYGDSITISLENKTNYNKYNNTGLYHRKQGATSSNFHGTSKTLPILGKGNWMKHSYSWTIPEDTDLGQSASFYCYGQYGEYGIIYAKNFQVEKGSFATPFVYDRRIDTTLKYRGVSIRNNNSGSAMTKNSYVVFVKIFGKPQMASIGNTIIINDDTLGTDLWIRREDTPTLIEALENNKDNYMLADFYTNSVYVNGSKLSIPCYASDVEVVRNTGTYILSAYIDYSNHRMQCEVSNFIFFNRDINPSKWTEQYCKEVTTHGFIVPEGKSDKPIYGTIPSSDYLVNNHSFFNISSTTEEFKLEGNKLYKVTSADGIVYTNVTNSSNVVSATNGSAAVITNTAGIGKINGTPAMPCRIEVSNYYL